MDILAANGGLPGMGFEGDEDKKRNKTSKQRPEIENAISSDVLLQGRGGQGYYRARGLGSVGNKSSGIANSISLQTCVWGLTKARDLRQNLHDSVRDMRV